MITDLGSRQYEGEESGEEGMTKKGRKEKEGKEQRKPQQQKQR